MSHFLIYNRFR